MFAGGLAGAALTACASGHTKAAVPPVTDPPRTDAPTTPAPSSTTAASTACPLTGLPAPGGQVPQRPALAVKVENFPGARPQYGLSAADIVYEEPVEGGITRFIAVFQCHDTSRIEPIRSGRIIDPQIVMQFGAHPLLSYAGAIPQAVTAIDSSPLVDLSAEHAPPSVYPRDPARVIPHNMFSSTGMLYSYAKAMGRLGSTPPPPVFQYGPMGVGATPAGSIHVAYEYSDLTWGWDPATNLWKRSYADTGTATLGEGGQITAANVVVMKVNEYQSPYQEDPTGKHENLLTLTGSGPAQVFRNGAVMQGTWNRPTLGDVTSFVNSSGQPMTLQPGQTWVELVPNTVAVAVQP